MTRPRYSAISRVGLPGMHDDGETRFGRQIQMRPEVGDLRLARGQVVVIVETGLSDRDHPGIAEQVGDRGEGGFARPGRLVGVKPRGGPDAVFRMRERHRGQGVLGIRRDRHHFTDTRGARAPEDRVAVLREPRRGQMQVGIEESRRAHPVA